MDRRSFFKSIGLGGLTGLGAGRGRRAEANQAEEALPPSDTKVGPLDLNEVPLVDAHVHPPQRMTLGASYDQWNASFVDAMVPAYDYPSKTELRARIEQEFVRHIWNLPRQTGYNNYIARVYNVQPTLEGFDSIVRRHIGTEADFRQYVASILDRERIEAVVLQSALPEPVVPATFIPRERFVWTLPLVPLMHPEWAQSRQLTTLQDVVEAVGGILEASVSNGCVGFKNAVAYYRPLGIGRVDVRAAERAFKVLLAAKPAGRLAQGAPYYDDATLDAALRTYQDYLLKRIFVKAGELERPVVIHTAVALHPALRFEFNDPLALCTVFQDDEILKAATRFVLIHTGYPSHHVVASMLSQFPNVFADVSFYAKFPGVLEETYRAFLALAPSEKVMHGSDSNNVPEEIGYCAANTRRVLARVLNDYRIHYGWSQADVTKIAHNVMHENARRVFRVRMA